MKLQENINRIKLLMGLNQKKLNLIKESVDPQNIIKLITDFVNTTDNLTRAKLIRGLTPEEKVFFNNYLDNFTNISKEDLTIKSIDDLISVSKTDYLIELSKSFGKNVENIRKMLKNQGIDYSKYVNLQKLEVPQKTNDEILDDVLTNLSSDNVFKVLINKMKNKKFSEIDPNEIFSCWMHLTDISGKVTDPKSLEIINNLKKEFANLNSEIQEIDNFTKNLKTETDVKQVAGVNISSEELTNLKKIVEEKGIEKSWGWNAATDTPISVKAQVNGKVVNFSVTDVGPRIIDWNAVLKDDLWKTYFDEYSKSGFKTFPQFIFSKFSNEPDKLNLYLPKYKVLGGVRLDPSSTVDGNMWVIVNSGMKPENFDFVLSHEMTHVGQKSMEVLGKRQMYTVPSKFKTTDEALDFLYRKSDFTRVEKGKTPILKFDDFKNLPEAQNLLDEFSKLIEGRNPMDTYPDYEKFMNWAYDNGKLPKNLFDFPNINVTYKTSNFGADTKKRAFDLSLDLELNSGKLTQEQIEKLKRIKSQTQNMDETQLLNYLKNNSEDPEIKKLVIRTSNELGYYLSRGEIEADFSAALQEILKIGTNEDKTGFATWLVDWLRNSNKMETLYAKPEPPTKESFIQKVKNFFTKTTNKPIDPNNPFYDDMSWYFFDFLKEIETKYKKIYPDDAQKIYKGMYKQAYELISKGYPALLPFIVAGAEGLLDDEGETTTTNESKRKNLKLTEIYNLKENEHKNFEDTLNVENFLSRRITKKMLDTEFENTKILFLKRHPRSMPFEDFLERFIRDIIDELDSKIKGFHWVKVINKLNIKVTNQLKDMYEKKIHELYKNIYY
jgi:hypothetical protein